jgi:hypothetical protein
VAFDIRALDKASGELDERALSDYLDESVALFVASPEGQAREAVDPGIGFWAHAFVEYGHGYLGATPSGITAANAEELLNEIFPRKLATPFARRLATTLGRSTQLWNAVGARIDFPFQCIDWLWRIYERPIGSEQENRARLA